MPTEARGNYLSEAPHLRETKTYLKCRPSCKPPFWKPLNRHISAIFSPIFMKFGTVIHFGTQRLMYSSNLYFSTILLWQSYVARGDTTCWQLFRPDINTTHFYFLLRRSYVKLLDYWRAENFLYTSGGPWGPRPVAFATSATWLIRHWSCDGRSTINSTRVLNVLLSTSRYDVGDSW